MSKDLQLGTKFPTVWMPGACNEDLARVAAQTELPCGFEKTLAGPWICNLIDDEPSLCMLGAPKDVGASVLADDRRVLESSDRIRQDRHYRRGVTLVVPCTQRDDRVTTGRVECAGDKVGLPAEARVDQAINEAGVGLGEQVDLHGRVDRQHGRVR